MAKPKRKYSQEVIEKVRSSLKGKLILTNGSKHAKLSEPPRGREIPPAGMYFKGFQRKAPFMPDVPLKSV